MADIIDFNTAKEATGENEEFAIRQDDGDLKPMEEWNGGDWEALVEVAMADIGEAMGVNKWDAFASFMHTILSVE